MKISLPKDSAFTLIELLVVIAIIGLLLAILLPGLQMAKKQARKVICSANLSQLAKAVEVYEFDYDNKGFAIRNSGTDTNLYWMGKLADYMGGEGYGQVYNRGENIPILLCPSAPASRFATDPARDNGSGQWGTNAAPWEWHRQSDMSTIGSYCINGWVVYDSLYGGTADRAPYMFRDWLSVSPNVPLFGDGLWTAGWPMGTDPYPADLNGDDTANLYTNSMARFCLDRHSRRINLIYKDLHVATEDVKDLWFRRWHKDYVTPNNPIP